MPRDRRGHAVAGLSLLGGLLLACQSTDPASRDCDAIAAALVTSVEVVPIDITLAVGDSLQLQARALSCQGELTQITSFVWSSTDAAIAAATASGMVRGSGAGSARVVATAQGQSGAVRVQVVSTAPARLTFVQQPGDAAAGTMLAPAVRVEIADAQGRPVVASAATVTLSLVAVNGATLGGTTTAVAVDGIASFPALTVTRTGAYALVAGSPGLSTVTSASFSITAGPARRMLFSVQPCPTPCAARAALVPAPRVQLQDEYGNAALAAEPIVSVELIGAGARTTLNGTRSVRAVAGVATFSALTVSRSASNVTLRATSGGLPASSSRSFSIGDAVDDDDDDDD